jgi:hypothetical protein
MSERTTKNDHHNMWGGSYWDAYRDAIADIESSYNYDIKGGYNDAYDGMYQMGKVAKIDAGRLLGETIGHDEASRKKFREDSALQERAFKAFTQQNDGYLTHYLGEDYHNLPDEEKLALLGYAHNQGVGNAIKYFRGGEEGEDAFGTKGGRYASTVRYNLGTAGLKDYATVLRNEGPEWFEERGLLHELNAAKDAVTGAFSNGTADIGRMIGSVVPSLNDIKNLGADHYTAVEGDNPYNIAKAHDMSLEDLVSLNPEIGLALESGQLGVGQDLRVGGNWFEKLF